MTPGMYVAAAVKLHRWCLPYVLNPDDVCYAVPNPSPLYLRYKKTVICQEVAKAKNVCQVCLDGVLSSFPLWPAMLEFRLLWPCYSAGLLAWPYYRSASLGLIYTVL